MHIESRLKRLEHFKRTASERKFSDAELAVRAIWMIESKAPGWERVAELLGLAAKRATAKVVQ